MKRFAGTDSCQIYSLYAMEFANEPFLVVFSTVSMSIVPSNSSEVEHRDAGSVTVTMECLDIQMITGLLLPLSAVSGTR